MSMKVNHKKICKSAAIKHTLTEEKWEPKLSDNKKPMIEMNMPMILSFSINRWLPLSIVYPSFYS